MNHEQFTFNYIDGESIRGDLRYLPSEKPQPLLIFCHGFKGFKNWGFYPHLTSTFAKKGFATLVFNFSLNGVGEDLLNFTCLEKFKENTFTREVEELKFVVAQILSNKLDSLKAEQISSIGLVGHSRGGVSSLSVASSFPEIKAVSTLAAISRMRFPDPDREKEWRKTGQTQILNMRTGQKMPLGVPLLDDMYQHRDRIEQAARKLTKPLLVIHGDKDETVGLEEANELHAWADNSQFELIEGGDHVFNICHPWQGTSANLEKVISLLEGFFREKLR